MNEQENVTPIFEDSARIEIVGTPEEVSEKKDMFDEKRKKGKRGRRSKAEIEAEKAAVLETQLQAERQSWAGVESALFAAYRSVLSFAVQKWVGVDLVIRPETEQTAKDALSLCLVSYAGEIPEKWRPLVALGLATGNIVIESRENARAKNESNNVDNRSEGNG